MKITFTNVIGTEIESPQPSSKILPEWYQKTDSYINQKRETNGKGITNATIKKCMPVFDAITAGYIITSPADVFVSIKEGEQYFEWASLDLIGFHSVWQNPLHPDKNQHPFPKWHNPWAIKTPKGYSTLFIQPMHRESLFTVFPGVVDTDTYTAPVNIPFVIKDPKFEGLIPKGTPIVQVIPFKRENWEMKIGSKKEFDSHVRSTNLLLTRFFDRYKSMFWSRKEYK